MGVLNVTPDSFSDGGLHLDPVRAVDRAREMVREGATVIDVGGESTRPGADPVPVDEELRRVVPVVEALAAELVATPVRISVDTRNEATARAAVAAGATLLNDVSASLWPVAAETGAGWVAMHMRGDPRTMQDEPTYGDVVTEVRAALDRWAGRAEAAGVTEVWVDPGIGFGKTAAHNLALLAHLDRLVADGRPVAVGTSRKRFLGVLLARAAAGLPPHPGPAGGTAAIDPPADGPVPVGDRVSGSLVTAAWAMIHGARMVRVHDVAPTARLVAACPGPDEKVD